MEHYRYLTTSTARRELQHRRVALLGSAVLIVLATSPVLVHHAGAGAGALLAGYDHFWALCVTAMLALLRPVHDLFHVLLGIGFAFALWDRGSAWWRVQRSLRPLQTARATPTDGIHEAALAARVPVEMIRVIDAMPNPAFTVGWLRPRIYVARGLSDSLSREELGAVLLHEYAHARRLDPARLSLLRFMGCLLFWLPALRRLAADVADESEIAADDAAGRKSPLVLASAILRVASWRDAPGAFDTASGWTDGDAIVSGFHGDRLLERRIRRLAGEAVEVRSHLTRGSLVAAACGLVLVWMSGLAVIHPLATGAAEGARHCEHRHESPVRHLFCGFEAPLRDGRPCLHESAHS